MRVCEATPTGAAGVRFSMGRFRLAHFKQQADGLNALRMRRSFRVFSFLSGHFVVRAVVVVNCLVESALHSSYILINRFRSSVMLSGSHVGRGWGGGRVVVA